MSKKSMDELISERKEINEKLSQASDQLKETNSMIDDLNETRSWNKHHWEEEENDLVGSDIYAEIVELNHYSQKDYESMSAALEQYKRQLMTHIKKLNLKQDELQHEITLMNVKEETSHGKNEPTSVRETK